MLEFLFIAWAAGFVLCFLACGPFLFKSFVNGGSGDGFGMLILVTLLAVVFTPFTLFGLCLMAFEKLTGKKVV